MHKKKVLLHGAFGGSNYGDVLFGDTFHKEMSQIAQPVMKTGPYMQKRLGIKHTCEFINFFRCQAVVFCPGGYFGEPNREGTGLLYWRLRMLMMHAFLGVLCIIFKKPYAIIGIGVGPINFKVGRWVVKNIFNGAKYVTVRDEESLHYLFDMGVDNRNIETTVDALVYKASDLLLDEYISKAKGMTGGKKVFLLHIPSGGAHGIMAAQAAKSFLCRNTDYTLVICTDFLYRRKNQYIEKIKSVFDKYEFLDYSPELLTAMISLADIILTTKLHVGIIGASLGKSVLSVPTHDKTIRFYRQINASERCVPLSSITKDRVVSLLDLCKDTTVMIDEADRRKSYTNFLVLRNFIESFDEK